MHKEAFLFSLNFLIVKSARFLVNLPLEETVMKRRTPFHTLRRVINPEELVLIVSDGWVSMRRIGPNSSCVLLLISLRRGVVGLLPAREGLKGLNNCCFTLQELGQTNSWSSGIGLSKILWTTSRSRCLFIVYRVLANVQMAILWRAQRK